MLEKATDYAREKGIGNICFARSRAERLPFPDDVFDRVIYSRGLHKFPDTIEALSEMARVMKGGAWLSVLTVVKQGPPTLKMISERVAASNPLAKEALEAFDVKEIDKYLSQTGFRGFAYTLYGYFILFHAEKGEKYRCLPLIFRF